MEVKAGFTRGVLFAVIIVFLLTSFGVLACSREPQEQPALKEIHRDLTFAKYQPEQTEVVPGLPEYAVNPSELANLSHFEAALGQKFTSTQIQALQTNHFFLARNLDKFYDDNPQELAERYDDWTHLYDRIGGPPDPVRRRPENAVFITSDFLLHLYHRLLERQFEYIEQRNFYPILRKISNTMLDLSIKEYEGDNPQKDSLKRLIAYFAVPAAILNGAAEFSGKQVIEDNRADTPENITAQLERLKPRLPADSYAAARAEMALILEGEKVTPSPLLGRYQQEAGLSLPEDYTQFQPRSHYSKNPALRAYFRAMMWYGRMNFLAASPELTRDAANIVLLLEQAQLSKDWENIYLATGFFVGESDDLGWYEYRKALKDTGLDRQPSPGDDAIKKLQQEVRSYRKPRLMGSVALGEKVLDLSKGELQDKTRGFRFMGQRFTPDAFIFSYLTQGQEKPDPQTGERLPSRPTALMVMQVMGSKTAEPLVSRWIEAQAPDSKKVLALRLEELKKQFAALTLRDWTQNLYWSWLYTIRALLEDTGPKGYPGFMKSPHWSLKNLQASLGSWTELKHDTLLYAKQVYAEMGNGGEELQLPPVPKGYVEPEVKFFDRLIPLIEMTRDGFRNRGLLDNEFQERTENFLEKVIFFRKLAVAQLQNEKIFDEDFETLRLAPGILSFVVSPLPGEVATENFARTALIADVFTDAVKGQILYEAVGLPNYIYVAVKDQNGLRLTKGLVYSHYEFTGPLGKRLTDEDWRGWNYTPDKRRIPEMAEWARALIK